MSNIKYYSTNWRFSNKKYFSFKEALFMGMAPDKGLFMPSSIPQFSKEEIIVLGGDPYYYVAFKVLRKFLNEEMDDKILYRIMRKAYDFEVPIERIDFKSHLLKLGEGPTASFKDFAARAMAGFMNHFKEKETTILVATSGDTGSAVGEAFKNLDGFKVYILYPKNEVSPMQKKQLDTIGGNVKSLSIDGKFDDCQNLVKEAFSDNDLSRFNLTSCNSINIGRILPQICYYFYAYAQVNDQQLIFSIPSGNFGNSLGCEFARRMGLPVEKIIIATNDNDEFPKFLATGIYEKVSPSKDCLSNAMNVGNPSNLARYFELYGGHLDKDGIVHKMPDLKEMRRNIYSISTDDELTLDYMRDVYKISNFIIEPHTAVGIAAVHEWYQESRSKNNSVCLETAHPAKFSKLIKKELNVSLKLPSSLESILQREGNADELPKEYNALKEYLLNSTL